MDFDASRLQQQVKVVTAAAPVQVQAAAAPFTANLASAQQFPSLGARPVQAPTTAWNRPLYAAAVAPSATPVTPAPAALPATASTPVPVATRVITGPATQTYPTYAAPAAYPPVSYPYAAPVRAAAAPVVRTVVKEMPDKDRRSRMAISTVHQAPKKGGAGGSFTWGAAGDVQDSYDPAPVTETKVMLAPAQAGAQPSPTGPFTANLASAQQFPALSSNSPQMSQTVWHTQPAAIKEAPPPAASPAAAATSSPGLAPSPAPATAPASGSPVLAPAPVPTPAPATTLEAPEEAPAEAQKAKEGSNCSIQ